MNQLSKHLEKRSPEEERFAQITSDLHDLMMQAVADAAEEKGLPRPSYANEHEDVLQKMGFSEEEAFRTVGAQHSLREYAELEVRLGQPFLSSILSRTPEDS